MKCHGQCNNTFEAGIVGKHSNTCEYQCNMYWRFRLDIGRTLEEYYHWKAFHIL